MSIKFFQGEGPIGETQRQFGYATAVQIGNIVKISGQGGWDANNQFIEGISLEDEIRQAFENVEWALNAAGATWTDVFNMTTYVTEPFSNEVHGVFSEELKKRCKNAPLWTQLGVRELGFPQMRVEIVVEAYVD